MILLMASSSRAVQHSVQDHCLKGNVFSRQAAQRKQEFLQQVLLQRWVHTS